MIAALFVLGSALAAPPEVIELGSGYTHLYALVGDGVVIVDTGYPGDDVAVLKGLAEAGIAEDKVTAIVITHAHSDHTGGAAALAARLQVPVLMGAGDVPEAAQGVNAEASPTSSRAAFMSRFFPETFDTFTATPVNAPMSLAEYGVDAQVSPVGGHTEGSLIVTAGTTLFVGDLIRGGVMRRKTPRLHYYQLDIAAAHAAVGAALGPEVTVVLPAHGGPLTPEAVRRFLAD